MTYEKCPSCGTRPGDGWCRACDAESDRLNRPEDGADPRQSVRLGIVSRKPTVSKHRAANDAHLRAVIDRLDQQGDAEAADTIAWLVWWRDLDRQREEFLLSDGHDIRAEIAETARAIEATEERTPMPDVAPELLPCPFCGDEPMIEHTFVGEGYDGDCHMVGRICCSSCQIGGSYTDAPDQGASRWNRRADRTSGTGTATILRYLYAEAGVRLAEIGAGEPLRIAYATLRKDIRGMAERFGVELEG